MRLYGLQWGRDLEVAESRYLSLENVIAAKTLQWGRDLEVAERTGLKSSMQDQPGRFNGAATWKSRKGPASLGQNNTPCSLQWGRDLEVAESG